MRQARRTSSAEKDKSTIRGASCWVLGGSQRWLQSVHEREHKCGGATKTAAASYHSLVFIFIFILIVTSFVHLACFVVIVLGQIAERVVDQL